MRFLAVIVVFAICAMGTTKSQADPIYRTCPLSGGFTLQKQYDSNDQRDGVSWTILYKGRAAYVLSTEELNDIYGGFTNKDFLGLSHGGTPQLDCSDIYNGSGFFAFRMGWNRDLLMAFGIAEVGSKVILQKLHYYAHNDSMDFAVRGNELQVTFGTKRDYHARLCWSPNGDGQWWHNHHPHEGLGPCINANWPWTYDNSGVQEIILR